MVSFQCEGCGDVLTKKKLSQHYNQCWAPVSCIDCMTTFPNGTFQSHTSCMTESEKYYGQYHRPEKENKKSNKSGKRTSVNGSKAKAMLPIAAHVEDAVEGGDARAVAVVDVPPRAPTPPPAAEPAPELENVNVFDFLVGDATPRAARLGAGEARRMLEQATPYGKESHASSSYRTNGYSYGNAPLERGTERYDSSHNPTESPGPFVTPAPKEHKKDKRDKKEKRGTDKSDKKRKRNVEDLDSSSVKRPVSRDQSMLEAPSTGGRVLHSGLTGGLDRLVTDHELHEDRIDAAPTPISPSKRSKREKDMVEPKRPKDSKKDRRKSCVSDERDSRQHRSRSPERERRRNSDRHEEPHRLRSHREVSVSSEDRSRISRKGRAAVQYPAPSRPTSVQPSSPHPQMVPYIPRAELFLSLVTKGPESQHGLSMNKVLKRYHRERDVKGDGREEEDKELWKSLRLRRNDRGEIVLVLC